MPNFEGTTHMNLYQTCANCFEDIHSLSIFDINMLRGKNVQWIRLILLKRYQINLLRTLTY